jgi:hypothetical protein
MEHVYDSAEVLRIALEAARPWGFALGGGRALLAHGVHRRPTLGIDLVTDREGGVRDGAAAVAEALSEAGFPTEEVEDTDGFIEGLDSAMVELAVYAPSGVIPMSLGIQPRRHPLVEMSVGAVLHLEDLAAGKVAAMANRADVKDFIDVAALQTRFGVERLQELAAQIDPGLTDEDYAAAIGFLRDCDDDAFEEYGADARAVKLAFQNWAL